ncbi:Protein N-acetyltransferase, RimJ/RimL family [Thermoactinomyces sp. DSM 45891]|uniref:GNAT family N-acetyltransferase n=1 Tax=Thermoactinomyces sp. DSM 45891 TaxID=1761907 RepID=UPI000918D7AA|nr:GNAT family N-acetyltransferase [Thermoactinomyces sp. DSM 45891]SFX35259.1 Protein N-acetyltransferase, RimJ/RimL family [Thermoactinomyces sp. DSM 45891]
MELIIRKAHVSDAERLLDYGLNIAEESPFLIITPEEMKAEDVSSEENWIKSFESSGNVLLVAEIEGEIVGSLNCNRPKRSRVRHIGTMGIAVRKAYWNQKVGTELIETLFEWAKENEVEEIQLTVLKNNDRAIYVYQKLGFQVIGERPRAMKYEDGTYADEVLMSYYLVR